MEIILCSAILVIPTSLEALTAKVPIFGIDLDPVSMDEAVSTLQSWLSETNPPCRMVVTPNVDHTVLLRENQAFQEAYSRASLVLADGHPVVWASRLLGKSLPERVPGSELVPALFDSYQNQGELKVFLLGAAEGVGLRAEKRIQERWPRVKTVGVYSPPFGFEKRPEESQKILEIVNPLKPDVIVLGLGAPKQEIWANQYLDQLAARAVLCVGATIDFLAGEKSRAPLWMQRSGLEWFHRVCDDPKRLALRYTKDAWVFPQLVAKEMVGQLRSKSAR